MIFHVTLRTIQKVRKTVFRSIVLLGSLMVFITKYTINLKFIVIRSSEHRVLVKSILLVLKYDHKTIIVRNQINFKLRFL